MVLEIAESVTASRPEVRPRDSWERAIDALNTFLDPIPASAEHVVLCHSDADGLCAGVVIYRALERSARGNVRLLATGKGESAWSEETMLRLGAERPAALLVLDLGSRPKPIYPGVPTLLIDHHRPLGVPPSGMLISSYKWEPILPTAALAYWLGSSLADLADLDWIAAVGIIADEGPRAPFEPLPGAKARYGSRLLQEAAVLVNAARRSSSGDASVAVRALLAAREPGQITRRELPEAQELARMRKAFNNALARAKRAAPEFSGPIALVRVRSGYQVHPVLAQIWRARLPDHIVMVANEGYQPGHVYFALRTATDTNLLDYMQAFRHGLDATEVGYGHDKATGGSVTTEEWKRLLETLGFRP